MQQLCIAGKLLCEREDKNEQIYTSGLEFTLEDSEQTPQTLRLAI